MNGPASARVVVVVPAHNEEATISACLDSISSSVTELGRTWPGVRVVTVVVADACTDRTEELAIAADVRVARISAESVGVARRIGVEVARELIEGDHPDDWIASTDADSRVPPAWLSEGMRHIAGGADLVIGTVRPDFSALPYEYEAWWHRTHPPGRPNGHVHGANLGIRTSSYRAVDGFGTEKTGEDVGLVERLRRTPVRETHTDGAEVITSARLIGRAPGGYSRYLAAQLSAVHDPAVPFRPSAGWPETDTRRHSTTSDLDPDERREELLRAPKPDEKDAAPRITVGRNSKGGKRIDIADTAVVRPGRGSSADGD